MSRFYLSLWCAMILLSGCTSNNLPLAPSSVALQETPTILQTITSNATPNPIVTPSPSTTLPSLSSTKTESHGTENFLAFPKTDQIPNGILLDDRFIYFSLGAGDILRQPLNIAHGVQSEFFAKIHYPAPNIDGSIHTMPRLIKNSWLYYVDMGDPTIGDRWTLRSKNTITLEEKEIARGKGCFFDFDVDGDTAAISFTPLASLGPNQDQQCEGNNMLETIHITNGQTHQVKSTPMDAGYLWLKLSLSGDALLAVQSSSDPQKDVKTVIFDLKTDHSDLLSNRIKRADSVNCGFGIAMTSNWIACNVSGINTILYDLSTTQQLSFTELIQSDMSKPGVAFQDRYLYWTGPASGNIFSFDRKKIIPIFSPKTNEFIREMVIYGNRAAWLIIGPSGYTIGWKDIPQD